LTPLSSLSHRPYFSTVGGVLSPTAPLLSSPSPPQKGLPSLCYCCCYDGSLAQGAAVEVAPASPSSYGGCGGSSLSLGMCLLPKQQMLLPTAPPPMTSRGVAGI